ncbi:MAG: rRNA maturation RNase YbeY [Rikenellaceae bacterium]
MDIQFFAQGCRMRLSKVQQSHVEAWIEQTVLAEKYVAGDINIILCHDDYLIDINRQYLNHDYPTDIITFDNTELGIFAGELFISVDTVKENAKRFETSFEDELHRVIIHGVLHLLKYDDTNDEQQAEMTSKENFYLERLKDE